MRDFTRLPAPGGARGPAMLVSEDIPVNVISLHPGGGSLSHATPTGPGETGSYTYAGPVKSAQAGRLHKAGKR
jgi:hypothetical protein